jgi:DNA adenine methylase
MKESGEPKPFLKWAGGKQALVARLLEAFPQGFRRYYEPFLGGGSVFFTLRPPLAVLCDRNEWLVATYLALRDHVEAVEECLGELRNTREDYLRIRDIDPLALEPPRRAAHFIYLNKTGFRGLFRVNKRGRFNVPYGAYERRYADPENLRRVAAALRDVTVRTGDFERGLEGIEAGDFAYIDPPYYKLGGYSDFDRYTPTRFDESDHRRLARYCVHLDQKRVSWAVSNSDTPLVRELFDGFCIRRLHARREINLSAANRSVVELLITNC